MRNSKSRMTLLVLCVLAVAAPAVAKDKGKPDADKAAKKATFATFTLKEDYPEGPAPAGVFGELKPRLQDIIERMDKAAKDDKIKGIVLKLRSPEVGLGKVDELRAAVARVRKAGKRVYADVQSAMTKDYLIASACDEIVMPPAGDLMITGLQAEVTFFKGLLDKLGIQADFIQIGAFKGASEPLTRTDMSPEFRQQFESVIDNYYLQIVNTIAADRKLDPGKVKDLIDEGLFMAKRAKEAGLVDRVCYEDELESQLKQELQLDELVFEKDYGKKKIDTDFSGLGGFMKLIELMTGTESAGKGGRNSKIAVVYAVGTIMSGESKQGLMSEESLGGDTIIKAIRQAEEDEKVKAIVLRVDSPGGSALASDLVWREIVRAKKPLVASMGDIAASGGYYISMGAKQIYAEPGTLTGSIGVVGGKLAVKGLMNKIGVTTEVIRRGKNSGLMSATDPFTPEERDAWKRSMTEVYGQFTTKAAEGRKMNLEKLEGLAAGRLFTGKMAVENGLADKLGTLADAVAGAKELAGLKADEKVDLMILPQPKSFFENLFGGDADDADSRAVPPQLAKDLTPSLAKPLLEQIRGAQLLLKLFSEPTATVLPYHVEFK